MGLTKTQSGGLEDESVTLAKIEHGTSSNDGKFLRANNGADPTFETISIPVAFPSGTKMLFQQTSAPTGWTKVTSGVDNKALRIVSGTVGSGGSSGFTTAFADRSLTANAANTTATGTVDSHTLSISQMPAHVHHFSVMPQIGNGNAARGSTPPNGNPSTDSTGGGGGHSHGFTGSAHNHSITVSNLDLAVEYLDVIIASKD